MNAIAKAIDTLNEVFGRVIAPLIAVITLIVLYDIALRLFTGRPSDWAFDITKMLFGAHFMLMAAYGLSAREQDVTRLVLQGDSTAQIAAALFVSPTPCGST